MKIEVHNMITHNLLKKYTPGQLASMDTQETHVDNKEVIASYKETIALLASMLILVTLLAGLFGFWAIHLRDSIVWHQHLEHKEETTWQSN